MNRFIMMLGLLGGYAYNIPADEISSPTVNSKLASSPEFPEENFFNNDDKGINSIKSTTQRNSTN